MYCIFSLLRLLFVEVVGDDGMVVDEAGCSSSEL